MIIAPAHGRLPGHVQYQLAPRPIKAYSLTTGHRTERVVPCR